MCVPHQTAVFPYEARVIDNGRDGVFIRSGPGRKYYPTGKLRIDDRVTVHRHDPGGWYMIAPLPSSFSWIRTEYVRRIGTNRGVLTENNIVVRVGSQFGDIHDVEQRRLSKGDEVQIIGEKVLRDAGRSIHMLKIRPPRGEFRWINGNSILPVDRFQPKNVVPDPFADPDLSKPKMQDSRIEGPVAKNQSPFEAVKGPFGQKSESDQMRSTRTIRKNSLDDLVERPMVRTRQSPQTTRKAEPLIDEQHTKWTQIQNLDSRFRQIINQDTSQWSFSQIESDYVNLQDSVNSPTLSHEIDRRLSALTRFKTIKHEYDQLSRLTHETNRRDAQLLALQRRQSQQTTSQVVKDSKLVAPDPHTSRSSAGPTKSSGTTNRSETQRPVRRTSGFDGAGIIQRSVTPNRSLPRHVLLAPGGRILAYLQSDPNTNGQPGVNLDNFLGRAMGVYGKRSYRAELQSDFIVVREAIPVRLKP